MSIESRTVPGPARGTFWLLFLLPVTLVGAAGTLIQIDPRLKFPLMGLLAAPAAAFLFFHPRIAFLLLALYVPSQFWWTDETHLLPGPLKFADDALMLILMARVLGDALRQGRPFLRTPWDLPFFLFFGVGVISAVLNHVPVMNAIAGLRAPVLYAVLFLMVVNAPHLFDGAYLRWVWRLLLVFAGLQILTGIYQYPLRGFGADALSGTLGPDGANDLGVFLLPFLFYLLSRRFDAGEGGGMILLGIGSMIATIILCGSRAAWFIAIASALLLWGRALRRPRVLMATLCVGAVAIVIIGRIILLQGAPSIERAIGVSGIYASLFLVSSGGGSFAYYPVVWRVVMEHSHVPFLGLGPGVGSSSAAVHLDAPIYRNILYDYFGQTRLGMDGNVESQVLATAGELGPLGFAAAIAMVLLWIVLAMRVYRRSDSSDERALAAGVVAASLGAILLTPIRNVWETPHLAFSLWLTGTILYVALRDRDRSSRVGLDRSAARLGCVQDDG